MSLLEKATLITTPTAHSNGTLHSIKGGAVADFDVVRGSAATRVNAEGLIEDISILSGEQVTNGDFSNGGTGWGFAGGATISDGKANIAGDGSAFTNITQTGVFTSGKQYVVKLDVIINSGLGLKFQDAANNANIGLATTSGTYTFNFTATSNSTLMIGRRTGGTAFDSSIDNISIKEVIDATNIPRIDYTTGEGVVLLEPQSTNLITHSEDFSNASWVKTYTLIPNSVVSPSGNLNAFEIVLGTTNGNLRTTVSVLSNTEYVFSFYVKRGTASEMKYRVFDFTNSTDIVPKTSYYSQTNTDSWVRIEVSFTTSATTTNIGCYIDSDSQGNGSFYAWGAQLEALPYATSYIPTSGAIATRLADSVSGAGDVNTFNSTEGVLYAEIAALADDGTNRYITLNSGIKNDSVRIYYNSLSQNQISMQVRSTNALQTINNHTLSDVRDFIKVAVLYKLNEFKMYVNGSLVYTDTSGLTPIGLSELDFDSAGANPFYGKVKALAVFNEALTDSELECLTKI